MNVSETSLPDIASQPAAALPWAARFLPIRQRRETPPGEAPAADEAARAAAGSDAAMPSWPRIFPGL